MFPGSENQNVALNKSSQMIKELVIETKIIYDSTHTLFSEKSIIILD